MDKDTFRSIKTSVTVVLICVFFVAFSFVFVFYMMGENEKDNIQSLDNAVSQKEATITKQIIGDFQTLEGIAACFGNAGIINPKEGGQILKYINDNNTFSRMGLADLNGNANLWDVSGLYYQNLDLSSKIFFQNALNGRSSISQTLQDPYSNAYINYYAVPIFDGDQVTSVLCAVNASDIFRQIVDAPVMNDRGFSNIISGDGKMVIRSQHTQLASGDVLELSQLGSFTQSETDKARQLLDHGESGSFRYHVGREEYLAVLRPLRVNNWFLLSVVPVSAMRQHYSVMAFGTSAIIVAACLIFLLLYIRQRRMMVRNRAALMHLAYDDLLTGCPNFEKFMLDAEKLNLPGSGRRYAIWYCDIKKFKFLNDMFGYRMGDMVLCKMAELFRQSLRGDELFCRVAADNFAGVRFYREPEELEQWFDSLLRQVAQEERQDTNRLNVELCMGVYCPDDEQAGLSLNDMVNRANMAQKSVKDLSGSRFAYFTREIREQTLMETGLENAAQYALEHNEFQLYLQPKIDIQHGNRIAGAEALARWNSPEKGMISPGVFIPVFEKNGFITKLDRYMFEQSCKWLRAYLDEGNPPISIAVNVSRLGLLQEDFISYYTSVKERYRIPDGLLELEYTESILLNDDAMFIDIVTRLQKNGFIGSLDDFGSGYTSLTLLKRLPIDVLKLDILFFRQDTDSSRERVIVSNVVSMARELGMRTVAEGVEAAEQVDFLRKAGCDIIQGFVFARPMPLAEFDALLRSLGDGPMETA